ncbi:hypothetical protein RQM47_14610 [Rubrivirga sp. S365]|uniref:hypothetical protein n=1 Tax=Rubrivirga sp. S365 TaxID=3076080 RepID=UPI0028C62E60|nr:hypothetical protein [Rubrivirga sp. S365]MDT7857875.1 hypothetical protein [Rubrivirga sp. S365]
MTREVAEFECEPAAAAAPLGFSTDRSAYAPGDSLVLRLVPTAYLEYNLCHALLERRRAGRWARERGSFRFLSDEDRARGVAADVCNDMLYAARAGRAVCYAVRLSRRLEPGTYRFQTETTRPSLAGRALSVRDTLATAPFEIR